MTTPQFRSGAKLPQTSCAVAILLSGILTARAHGQDPDFESSITVQTIGAGEPISVACQQRSLAAAAFDFAFNETTGDVAAIETEFGRLWVYPPGYLNGVRSAAPRSVAVGTRPVSIVWKQYRDRSYYVVICETDSELVVFDAATLEEVRRTRLPVRDLWRLTTSLNPDDPNVYYEYQVLRNGGVRRVVADTWEDAGEVVVPGALFAVTSDGRYLAADGGERPGSRSLTVEDGRIVQSRSFYWALQSHQHVCVPDPHGQILFVGQHSLHPRTEVWRADLSRQVNSLDFAVLTVSPTRPWLAGYRWDREDASLVFAGYPSLGSLVELEYPGPHLHLQFRGQTVQLANRQAPRRFRVFSDERAERLLIAYNEHVTVVPLADLQLPDGDVLHLDAPLHASARTGEELRIPLRGLPAGADVQVRNPPDGVHIEEGVLRWTPDDEQVGWYAVELDMTRGDDSAYQWVELTVDRPSFTLTGLNSSDTFIQVDPTGRRLLTSTLDATGQAELHLIDLKTGETAASAPLPPQTRVSTVQFPDRDGGNLIVFHGNSVSSVSWPDLESVTTYTIGRSFQNMVLVGDQWAIGSASFGGTERWRLGDGERVPFPPLINGIHEQTQNGSISGISQEVIGSRFADGWILEGVFYDDRLQTPRLLLRPWGFIRSERLDLRPLLRPGGRAPRPQTAPSNAAHRLLLDYGRMQAELSGASRQFVPPAGPPQNYNVVTLNLWTTAPRAQVASKPFCLQSRNDIRMFPAGSDAAILVGDRLYLWPTPTSGPPDAEAAEAGAPQFEFRQSHLVADAVGQTVFEHRVTGGSPPYRFELQGPRSNREFLSLPVDAETGNVTVDGSEAAEWVRTYLGEPLERGDIESMFSTYQAVADAEFEKIVGRPPEGVPVLLGMSVTVTDSEGRQAALPYEFFLEVARERWADWLQRRQERQQQAVAERRQAELEEQQRREEERQQREERQRYGLESPDEPVPIQMMFGGLLLAAVVSLVSLPVAVPVSATLLRAAFSMERRLVPPDVGEAGTNPTWPGALLASLATLGMGVFVGMTVSFLVQAVTHMSRLAPLYAAGLTFAAVLPAFWGIQAVMVNLILKSRWRRAMRISLYQVLVSLLIVAVIGGGVMAGLRIMN